MKIVTHTFVGGGGGSGLGVSTWFESGNPQVWHLKDDGSLRSRWKPSANPNDVWHPWQNMATPPHGRLVSLAATGRSYRLGDLTAFLFGLTDDGMVWWSAGGAQSWTQWQQFGTPGGRKLVEIGAAQDTAGRAYLWALDDSSQMWFIFQTHAMSAQSPWAPWTNEGW